MLRNDKDRAKSRRQLIGWRFLKRRLESLSRKLDIDASELYAGYDEQIEILSEELEEYEQRRQKPIDLSDQSSPFTLLQLVDRLPAKLLEARRYLELSQCEVAQKVNINAQQLSRYERSEYSTAPMAVVIALSQALVEAHAQRERALSPFAPQEVGRIQDKAD